MTVPPGDDLDDVLRRINRTVAFFDLPPAGFDPLTADPTELERFGIPPRPDRLLQPALTRFWEAMFAPPLEFLREDFSFALREVIVSDQLRVAPSVRRESSLNWSGAYVTPRDGRRFTEVHGAWVVPVVAAPSGTPATAELHSSIWIGLDGMRRYLDSSLPQIGTAQILNDPTLPPVSTTTWWQWWLRDHDYPPVTLPLVVDPGDRVMCSLHVLSDTSVKFIIINRTTNQIFPPFTMPSPTTDPPAFIQVNVSGATAEWIVERPTSVDTGEIYELPDYGTVDVTECLAVSAHVPPGPGQEQTLEGARLINMYKVEQNPSRRVTISVAERLTDAAVRTTYLD